MPGTRIPEPRGRGQQADINPNLIARAKRGDTAAFGQIYLRTAPSVRRYVRTIIPNPWDAEDVTQDVFLKIFTALGQYDPERGSFTSWILRVARNAAIDHTRRHRNGFSCAEVDQT